MPQATLSAHALNVRIDRQRLLAAGLLALAAAAALLQPAPAWALYKVVGPDGKVTYTDRPGGTEPGKTTQLRRDGSTSGADAEAGTPLPAELRQASQRYPVTLYTSSECAPCEMGRNLLTQRGVPFSEKHIGSQDDADAMEKVVGARTVPAITIGTQAVRGYSEDEWTSYLDAAGYPKQNKLPRGYAKPKAEPMTARKAAPSETAAASAPQATAPAPAPNPSGIRF